MKQVSSVFLLLFWLLILSNTSYGKSQEPEANHLKNQPFEILYFEELPEISLQELAAQSTDNSALTSPLAWSFEAFGKSFQVFLHPNTRLLAKIPQERRTQLENDLTFYRGTLEGISDSWVRLTRVGQKWSGMIWDGHEAYIIDSLSVITPALRTIPTPTSSEHSIYRLSDTRDLGNRTCGMGDSGGISAHPMTSFGSLMEELEDRVGVTAQGATRNIDMAVVTDQAFNRSNSNPNAAVIARMNVVDGIFSEQLEVQISLVDVLPLQSNGRLTSTNAGTLLRQFSQFSKSGSFAHPGVAHLFTGLNLDGSTVGIAYFRSVCSAEFGVGVNQITGTGAAGALTVAHELGHNFGAPHDNEDGSPCSSTPGTFLMNPLLNGRDQFSPCSMSQIQPVVDRASCITFINNDQADLEPRFQSTVQEAALGQQFSSILSVTNNGLASALNTRAEVSIPNGLSLENVRTTSGSCNGIGTNQATCTFNAIPPGNRRTITLALKGLSAGSFTLSASVLVENDLNTRNNSTQGRITITNTRAHILTPAPSSRLNTTSVTFTGGHTPENLFHSLWVGTTPGGYDVHRGPMTNHRQTVSGLPTTGTIYVRYWSTNSRNTGEPNVWFFTDHVYTMTVGGSSPFPPAMSSPTPNTTLTSTAVRFTGGHTSVDIFHSLWVGTTPGSHDLHQGPMTNHQQTVTRLPSKGTIYVRYWSTKSRNTGEPNAWFFTDQTYTMAAGGN